MCRAKKILSRIVQKVFKKRKEGRKKNKRQGEGRTWVLSLREMLGSPLHSALESHGRLYKYTRFSMFSRSSSSLSYFYAFND